MPRQTGGFGWAKRGAGGTAGQGLLSDHVNYPQGENQLRGRHLSFCDES